MPPAPAPPPAPPTGASCTSQALEHQGYAEEQPDAYAAPDAYVQPAAADGFDPMGGDTAHMMGNEAPLAQAHLVPVPVMAPPVVGAEAEVPPACPPRRPRRTAAPSAARAARHC